MKTKKSLLPIISNSHLLLLCIIFVFAFFLRFYNIPQNLFFGPEQGKDFLVIKDIALNHKFTLIGAKTDISGIFHGPIYYYLSVIPFLISNGDPIFISAFFILLNSITVFFIYFLGKDLFDKEVGFLSSVLFAVSFGSIVYSRWLSSHPLAIPLSTLFILFIFKSLKGSKFFLLLSFLLFALIGQAEFLNFLFFSAILLIFIIIYRNEIKIKSKSFIIFSASCLFFLSTANYLLFDLRHNFLITKNILKLIAGGGYYKPLIKSVEDNTFSFLSSFRSFIFPSSLFFSTVVFSSGLFLFIKKACQGKKNLLFLLVWLTTPVILLMFLRHDVLEQFFVGVIPASILFVSFLIKEIKEKNKAIGLGLFILFVISNIIFWKINVSENKNIFFQSTQPDLKLVDQIKVVDEIYRQTEGKGFSFQSYTIPYWAQEGWEYLFWHYGTMKYSYAPMVEKSKILFVIVQDDPSNKIFQDDWYKNTMSKWGTEVGSFRFGALRVIKMKTREKSG